MLRYICPQCHERIDLIDKGGYLICGFCKTIIKKLRLKQLKQGLFMKKYTFIFMKKHTFIY